MNTRLPDSAAFMNGQKPNTDVALRNKPSDKGLPFLDVELIQKESNAFPPISLKKVLTLTDNLAGPTLKMYDDTWEDNDMTVVEMDGEIGTDNMEAHLKNIEEKES
eukprot:13177707-Heterocapsa_arctica.AAC.1